MSHVELVQLPQITNNDKNFLNALNKNLTRIKEALDDALSRTGKEPNQMGELLDMNGHRIANVGMPVEDTDVPTKAYIDGIVAQAEAAIADINNIIIAARQALQNWAAEYIYPVAQAAVDQAQAAAADATEAKEAAEAAQAATEAIFNDESVQTLLENLDTVLAIANHLDSLEAVAAIVDDIQDLADNITSIVAVAGSITNVNALANALPTLTAIYNALSVITDVKNKLSEITTVAGIASDVSTVAANTAKISAVYAALDDIGLVVTNIAAIIAAPENASKAYKWAEGTDEEVGPLGGTHSSKGWAEYAAAIVTGVKIYGGGYNASTGVATLSNSAKVRLGTEEDSIVLTNDTTPVTGYAANESIEYVVTANGSFAGHTLRENDILWSSGAGWHKIDNSETVIADATEDTKGILRLATSADALAGTDNTKAMTPLKTKAAIEALAPMPTVLVTTGDSGSFTAAQMALINDHTKIENDGELFVLSNKDSSLIYKTFINGDVSNEDKMAFKAIYVNCSPDAVNYGSWTREDVEVGGSGAAADAILHPLTSAERSTLLSTGTYHGETVPVGTKFITDNDKVELYEIQYNPPTIGEWYTLSDYIVCYKEPYFYAVVRGSYTVYRSADCSSWSTFATIPSTSVTSNTWRVFEYCNNKFFVLSNSDELISDDGVNWSHYAFGTSRDWTSMAYGNNVYVLACSNSYVSLMYSTNGYTWESTGTDCDMIEFINGAFYGYMGSAFFVKSTDGISFSRIFNTGINSPYSICFSDNNKCMLTAASYDSNVSVGEIGGSWHTQALTDVNGDAVFYVYGGLYIGGYFICFSPQNAGYYISDDGENFTLRPQTLPSTFASYCRVFVTPTHVICKRSNATSYATFTPSAVPGLTPKTYNKTEVDTLVNEGLKNTATGIRSLTIEGTAATSANCTNVGYGAVTSSSSSTALGDGATASGSSSTAIGADTIASGTYCTVLGRSAKAYQNYGTALGYGSQAGMSGTTSTYATAVGYNAKAYQSHSIALGYNAIAGASSGTATRYAIAIGPSVTASGQYSTSLGYSTTATQTASTALGYHANATATYAIQLGYGTNSTANTLSVGLSTSNNYVLLNSDGTIPVERLGGVTGSTDNLFLKKDGTWSAAGGGSEPTYDPTTETIEF